MLGTGARYAEYGITGGFFLFTTALIFGLAFPSALIHCADSLGSLLSATLVKLPKPAHPAIQGLLVALALLSVFIIGLVLELIGSVFWGIEAYVFLGHLVDNKKWMAKFVQAELPDDGKTYTFLADDKKRQEYYRAHWRRLLEPIAFVMWNSPLRAPFRRLEFNLIAKVLTSGAKTELLTEQISICRMSRGIATALYAAALLLLTLPLDPAFARTSLGGWLFLVVIILVILLPLSAFAITRGAYSRFAFILFSLVYASWKPQTEKT